MLLETELGERLRAIAGAQDFGAPAHVDAEVLSTLRRLVRTRALDAERAELALVDLLPLFAERAPLEPLLIDAFALRDRLSAYDALYVVLARQRRARLLSADSRLARAAEGLVEVVLP